MQLHSSVRNAANHSRLQHHAKRTAAPNACANTKTRWTAATTSSAAQSHQSTPTARPNPTKSSSPSQQPHDSSASAAPPYILPHNKCLPNEHSDNTKIDVQPAAAGGNNVDADPNKTGIRLSKKKGNKTDLFRVVMGLYQSGFFKSSDGSPATAEQVFSAFGEMLGDNFSDYANFILARSKHNNDSTASTQMFGTIQDSFIEYENDLIHNRDTSK